MIISGEKSALNGLTRSSQSTEVSPFTPLYKRGARGDFDKHKEDRKVSHIQVMFDPKTIALIGATEKEGAVGRTILENLLRSKGRRIFPVNPHTSKVLDVESYPAIAGVPEHVDLAVVATPARSVPGV